MDPFIESQRWQGFHTRFVTAICHTLVQQVRGRYVVDIGDHIFHVDGIPYRQHFLTISPGDSQQVITVIELLSPWNKSKSGGHKDYLSKRQNVLATMSHLVELDLLRGGLRLPTMEPLPTGDYYAFVCRIQQRPKADVYSWTIRDPLPEVPIPLAEGDADAIIDLQSIFERTYDRAGYDYALKYDRAVDPPLNDNDSDWVRNLLSTRDTQEKP